MKDLEYYERLISDSLDRPLSPAEAKELKQAMREHPELVEFQTATLQNAQTVRSLPQLKVTRTLKSSFDGDRKRNVFWSLWKSRLSLPVPVAAVLVVIVIASALFGIHSVYEPVEPIGAQRATTIEYVQIERLEPTTAVLIERGDENDPSEKEEL